MSRSSPSGSRVRRAGGALALVLAAAPTAAGTPAPVEDPYDRFIPPGFSEIASARSDFNGDGRQDLVFRHADGSIVARLMNGLTALGSATLVGPGGWSVVPPQ